MEAKAGENRSTDRSNCQLDQRHSLCPSPSRNRSPISQTKNVGKNSSGEKRKISLSRARKNAARPPSTCPGIARTVRDARGTSARYKPCEPRHRTAAHARAPGSSRPLNPYRVASRRAQANWPAPVTLGPGLPDACQRSRGREKDGLAGPPPVHRTGRVQRTTRVTCGQARVVRSFVRLFGRSGRASGRPTTREYRRERRLERRVRGTG